MCGENIVILVLIEEKSLGHVAMVAEFLDDNKPKRSLKKGICSVSNFVDLVQFHSICQLLAKFCRLNPKGPYLRLEKEKENFCIMLTYSL